MEEETLDGGGFDGDGEVGKGENKLSQNKNSHLIVCKKPPHNGGEPSKGEENPPEGVAAETVFTWLLRRKSSPDHSLGEGR